MAFPGSFRLERGDTIIEVLFATAVGGMIIVLAMSVMNRGVATAQMAVEHTMVRQAIDSQAEALRLLRDDKDAPGDANTASVWQQIVDKSNANPTASEFGAESCAPPSAGHNFFWLNAAAGSLDQMIETDLQAAGGNGSTDVFATPGRGLWIEPVSATGRSYIDFHIRACWEPPISGPPATLGTIVRIAK